MNHLPFIVGAYAIAATGIGGLLAWSALAMRRAEAAVERVRGER